MIIFIFGLLVAGGVYGLFSSNDLGSEEGLVYNALKDDEEETEDFYELIDKDLMEKIKPIWEHSTDKYHNISLEEYYKARFLK